MRKYFSTSTSFATLLFSVLFVGAGCISFSGSATSGAATDGGIFKTADRGDNWMQKTAVATTGDKRNISNAAIVAMVQDPQDPNAIYVGTADQGLWLSYDGGESWREIPGMNRGRVPAVAVDPKQKCTVYAASENKLMKSTDCSRTWNISYVDTKPERHVNAVAVDWYDPRTIWIGLTSGDVLRSSDGGLSWVLSLYNDSSNVLKISIHGGDTRKVFVTTKDSGIWRTDDDGKNWKDLRPLYDKIKLGDVNGLGNVTDISFSVANPNMLVAAGGNGLARSFDAGEKWEAVPLVTPPGSALIYALAVDPQDNNSIYYATATTFYKTANGGVNWIPKKMPTSRTATALMIDKSKTSVLYMGVTKLKQ